MLPEAVQAGIERIRLDRLSGAAALARQAAETLISAAPALGGLPLPAARQMLLELVRRLVAAQPAMAPLVNLANAVLWRSEQAGEGSGLGRAIEQAGEEFLRGLEVSREAVRRHGSVLIEDGTCVMTHSSSRTVLEALLAAREAGKRITVICTESRPQGEGVVLARRLAEAGVAVHLIVDAAIYARMPAATVALTGADAVSERGLVNKAGTSLLALAARARARPCHALFGGEKVLPKGYLPPPEPPKSPLEVLAEPPENVTVENFYFEEAPLDLFTGFVTEAGLLTKAELLALVEARRAHPALVELL